MKRNFALGVVLSVVSKTLMCDDIGEVYEMLNYMTGLDIHQLEMAIDVSDKCLPFLVAQHPWLTEYMQLRQHQITTLADCESRWGKEAAVEKLSATAFNGDIRRNIIRLLDSISEEERHDIFREYCIYCGSKNPYCQCWNDE